MAVSIQIGSYSLNSETVITETIQHDSATPIFLDTLGISRQDGAKLIASNYLPKQISLVGIIRAADQDALEAAIDEFKLNVSVARGNLDVDYAGAVRRYIVGTLSIAINRDFYHQSFAPFSVSFTVLDPPFAQAIESVGGDLAVNETLSAVAKTGQLYEAILTFSGTASPKPVLQYVIDTATSLSSLKISNTGKNQQLTISTAWAAGDQLLIDTGSLEVSRNGLQLGFTGFFPEFDVGSNTLVTQALGSAGIDTQRVGTGSFYGFTQPTYRAAMKFAPASSTTFPYVELLLQRTPFLESGTVTLRIETDNAGTPSGTLVTNGSVGVDVSAIPGGNWEGSGWVQFVFATPPSLTAATSYWLVLSCDGVGSGNKTLSWNRFNSSGDTVKYSTNSGATYSTTDSNVALNFKLVSSGAGWSYDLKVEYTKRFL